jgi:hypothetical protein
VLVGGRHSPAAPLSHALLLDCAAKRCETIELPQQQLTATWRQATVMLGKFLLMVGGRTVQRAVRTIAAFHLLDGRVVRGELPCGLHSTGVIKVRKYIRYRYRQMLVGLLRRTVGLTESNAKCRYRYFISLTYKGLCGRCLICQRPPLLLGFCLGGVAIF